MPTCLTRLGVLVDSGSTCSLCHLFMRVDISHTTIAIKIDINIVIPVPVGVLRPSNIIPTITKININAKMDLKYGVIIFP